MRTRIWQKFSTGLVAAKAVGGEAGGTIERAIGKAKAKGTSVVPF
jgi:hypothetical protein